VLNKILIISFCLCNSFLYAQLRSIDKLFIYKEVELTDSLNKKYLKQGNGIAQILLEAAIGRQIKAYTDFYLKEELNYSKIKCRLTIMNGTTTVNDYGEFVFCVFDEGRCHTKNYCKNNPFSDTIEAINPELIAIIPPNYYSMEELSTLGIREEVYYKKNKTVSEIKSITIFISMDNTANLTGENIPVATFKFSDCTKILDKAYLDKDKKISYSKALQSGLYNSLIRRILILPDEQIIYFDEVKNEYLIKKEFRDKVIYQHYYPSELYIKKMNEGP